MILLLKHLLKRLSFEVPFYAILFVCSNHIIITLKYRLLTVRITMYHLFYWIQGKHGKALLLRFFKIGFVRPHLEYGMPVCSPNLVADIKRLERI